MYHRRNFIKRATASGAALAAQGNAGAQQSPPQQTPYDPTAVLRDRHLKPKPDWVKPLFPWEQRAAVVNGRMMAYVDAGDAAARPVIMCHGNPRWGSLYRFFIPPALEAGYRVIVPDWVGSGYSDHPTTDAALTMHHHIADLVSLIDQLRLRNFALVGHDWGGPQGVGAALQRVEKLSALVLMNTWLFTDWLSAFHKSARPWTTWHAPILGEFFLERLKMLSEAPLTMRGMTEAIARLNGHVYEEPDSDHVTLTWPRTIPMREGDRGWQDMRHIEERLPELAHVPTILLWAPEDIVFPIETANMLKKLLPHAEGPIPFANARHFLQEDRGPDVAKATIEFLNRTVGAKL